MPAHGRDATGPSVSATQFKTHNGSRAQYGTGGSHRRSGFGVTSGSQIGTRDHQPSLAGTGRYSVEQPDQSGI